MAQNTFTGANLTFANRGIHMLCAEIVKFRKQVTKRPEFKSQSGWPDSLNLFLKKELNQLADTLENITYNPSARTQEQLEAEAGDTTRDLASDYDAKALATDDIVMPAQIERTLPYKLDGSDPNLPQPDELSVPNDFGRGFIVGLDGVFVEATRLDSRHQPQTISKYESAMIRRLLIELWTICERKGGETNRSDTPTGTLPSQEPQTFLGGQPRQVMSIDVN